jgi:uncharacterized membrane protein YphA (DoxX/SURF4 family)
MLDFFARHRSIFVWLSRIIVGAVFITSGLTKMIDPWGFVYKIEQYLNVWAMPEPRSLVVAVAMLLSGFEFLLGWLLATGCYKRTSVWTMSLVMAAMLPLTFYIMIKNPVSDCGCFGDFLVISNHATFAKNVVITLILIYLWRNNSKVPGLYTPYSQWIVGFFAIIYVAVIGLFGYNVQPLIDFRPYKIGTHLNPEPSDDADDAPQFKFVYEKDGTRQSFEEDNLPDSTWTFVDREEVTTAKSSTSDIDQRTFTVYNGDEDVTADVIADSGEQFILLIPDMNGIDVSSSYLVNEMYRYITQRGGSMIAVIAGNDRSVELWRDISMAEYDIYTSEDTSIKELARGNVAIVYLKDGVIKWKRTLSSIDSDLFSGTDKAAIKSLDYSGTGMFRGFTLFFLGIEVLTWFVDSSGRLVNLHFSRRRNRKKAK